MRLNPNKNSVEACARQGLDLPTVSQLGEICGEGLMTHPTGE